MSGAMSEIKDRGIQEKLLLVKTEYCKHFWSADFYCENAERKDK
jgi:hypothetical protein